MREAIMSRARTRSDLGRRIASQCQLRGISMGELADEVGISRNGLSMIIQGHTEDPRVSILVKIADELGCSVDYLVGRKDEP